ncbi:putative aminoadipate reductase [Flammula alnicola]|nr:putative aminoadipate reductase [Flammula alnicola]
MPLYSREFVHPPLEDVTEISYLEFGRACHRVAHHFGPRFLSGHGRLVVAFIALADTLLYQAVTPFPISPRNTAAAVVHLLQSTSCHHLVTTASTLKDLLDGVQAELNANAPDYDLVIDKYLQLGPSDLAMYLHSSGSTGFPKAIPQTHGTLVNWATMPPGMYYRDHKPRVRIATMHLPPFHTMGVYAHILFPLYSCTTSSLYPPVVRQPDSLPVMPTPDNILDHLKRSKANALIAVPTVLQAWGQDPEAIDVLRKLEFLSYAGGALSPKLGDNMLVAGVKLCSVYGATEFGSPTHPVTRKGDEMDWAYMEFSDRSKVRWVPQGDGTYECQFLTVDTHPLSIENLPDVKGYATADLFVPHPTKDYLWKIVGRVDDVIIHASGEKTVPPPIENVVMSSPCIMGVVMFGRAHDQPGILVEPKPQYAVDTDDEAQVAAFRNLIWSVIEEANRIAPAFSRTFKEMILITHKDKPLPRAGKGTVMRKLSLQVYEDEIEALYATVESTQATESIEPPATWDREHVEQWIVAQVYDLLSGKTIVASHDLFEQGLDSLSATILRRRITGALQSIKGSARASVLKSITQNTVYSHPTIAALADFLVNLVTDPHATHTATSRIDLIEEMIRKYSFVQRDIDTVKDSGIRRNGPTADGAVVLLTGSTGNLGSQVLEALLRDSRIAKVYGLNRPSSSSVSLEERHLERFRDKGLDESLLKSSKFIALESALSQWDLNLPPSLYDTVRTTVDIIIHTAWRLDFNLSLSSFESSIRGTRNLIELAHSSPHASDIKFIFTSSVASALSWDQSQGPYPEEVVLDPRYAVGNGYGESKYVTERILSTSALNAISLRIGQISGSRPKGAWAITDWMPILVKSSLALGALPTASGTVSWIPMDTVANCILELSFHAKRYPAALNVLHSQPIEWNAMIQYVADALVRERNLAAPVPLVPFQDWFSRLEKHASSPSDSLKLKLPAMKLYDFFKQMSEGDVGVSASPSSFKEAGGMTSFSLSKIQALSDTLKEVEPLGYRDAERWVKYWIQLGFFD